MKYKAILSYATDTKVPEPGMDVPYKEYLAATRSNGQIPVVEYLYPITVFAKQSLEFVVEADSRDLAVAKILAHATTRRAIGKAKFGEGGEVGVYTLSSDKEGLGFNLLLSVREYPPERQAKVIVID